MVTPLTSSAPLHLTLGPRRHEAARAAAGDQQRKLFYAEHYGFDILDPQTFRRGGPVMQERGLRSQALDSLLRISG